VPIFSPAHKPVGDETFETGLLGPESDVEETEAETLKLELGTKRGDVEDEELVKTTVEDETSELIDNPELAEIDELIVSTGRSETRLVLERLTWVGAPFEDEGEGLFVRVVVDCPNAFDEPCDGVVLPEVDENSVARLFTEFDNEPDEDSTPPELSRFPITCRQGA
jgi:hypothetical protein